MSIDESQLQELVRELRLELAGDVRFDRLTQQAFSTDASDFRKVPVGVVMPKNVDDICAAIELIGKFNVPLIPRGGGSSLSGQTIGTGVIIDHSKYLNRILELNIDEKWVEVEAGLVLDVLNSRLDPYRLMVGPDPASSAVATLGGMAGNNSTGAHSFKYGMIRDHIRQMEVVLADGRKADFNGKSAEQLRWLVSKTDSEAQLYRQIPALLNEYQTDIESGYPKTWRNVAGYGLNYLLRQRKERKPFNLTPLIVGSEGTLAVINKLKVGLVEKPAKSHLLILHYQDRRTALQDVPLLLEQQPAAVELMSYPVLKIAHDHPVYRENLKRFVEGLPGAILVVEFTGNDQHELSDRSEKLQIKLLQNGFKNRINQCRTPAEVQNVWHVRKSVLGLLVSTPGNKKLIWTIDDASVPVEELVSYTEEVVKMGREHGVEINFDAHASAGCLHMGLNLNLRMESDLKNMEVLSKEIMKIAIAHQGSTTGEHGEGLARSYFNKLLYGERLHQAFKKVKAIFDPECLLNPLKVVDAIEPWDRTWLKYHPAYRTPYAPKATFFDYTHYNGFAGLVEMCNGQGTCRSQVSGTMCPTFRLTRDENDSTRGRANTLRAAITGQFGQSGLASKEVYQALDLCLECKACRNECSTRVDMAKLKYEFLAFFQAKHGVPLRNRIFGNMALSSELGSKLPVLANALYQNNLFRLLLDKTLKIDKRRKLPQLASQTFRQWFKHHASQPVSVRGQVVLWDDCHLSYHEPDLGMAAVRILEAAGFEVRLVAHRRCCGRPLISKGLLREAKTNALHNVRQLLAYAEKEIPIIGVEPSCIACMRDEYPELLNSSESRVVARQSFFFEEFITRLAGKGELHLRFRNSGSEKRINVHTHCYQKAFGTASKVITMLKLLPNSSVEEINSGCCGMAGAFGYEKEHYDISLAIGEQTLFPAIRTASPGTLIAAAGTSCRQQIKDGTAQTARHPIQILADALWETDPQE